MNKMDQVWRMLGLECFERFNIITPSPNALKTAIDGPIRNPYYFIDEGLVSAGGCLDNHKLAGLITGEYEIEKIGK